MIAVGVEVGKLLPAPNHSKIADGSIRQRPKKKRLIKEEIGREGFGLLIVNI
jgi:hypothetical protein